jgi:inner membrane protein
MDTLTHALSGALVARATEPKAPRADQLPRRARVWVGFWAAAFPDSDFALLLLDPLTYLTAHRGITHSVVMLPLWAAVLAFAFVVLTRRKYSWRAFAGVCALGIGIHIAGDVITAFGTMIFAPLSRWRAQIPATFIIDPYFTTIIVAGLVASARWQETRLPAVAGLAALAALVGFQWLMNQRATAIGNSYIATQALTSAKAHAIPQPFSPFHWMVMIEEPRRYRFAWISLTRNRTPDPPPEDAPWLWRVYQSYRPVNDARWQEVSRFGTNGEDAALTEDLWQADSFARYRHFALFPAVYRVDRLPDRVCVWFQDLRFALEGRSLPFRYGGCRGTGAGEWQIYRLSEDGEGQERRDAIQ